MKIIYFINSIIFLLLTNILSAQNCNNTETELWGLCYNIQETVMLDLNDNSLSGEIPSEINELINLEYLDFRNNNLTNFESIINLPELKYLYLSNNQFDSFEESIYNLSNLEELWMSNNNLNSIIETQETCSFFLELSYNLSDNYICDSPTCQEGGEEIILFPNQNILNCCDDSLSNSDYVNYLGECFFENDLDIINNLNVDNINVDWNDANKISLLDLSNNQITDIPSDIWLLSELEILYLNNNSITEFPGNQLNSSTTIYTIDLSSNLIANLESNFCDLYDDININLSYNYICDATLTCLENTSQNCTIYGCTNSSACNYDVEANFDDESCYYSDGDYNNDGVINVLDIIEYEQYLLNNCDSDTPDYEPGLCKIDINNDDMVDILDITYLATLILGPGRGTDASQIEFIINENSITYNADGVINVIKIQLTVNNPDNFSLELATQYTEGYQLCGDLIDIIITAPENNELLVFNGAIESYYFEATNSTDYIPIGIQNNLLENSDDFIPKDFKILTIHPNPFNPETTISFEIANYNLVTINIYDINGNLVDEIFHNYLYPGKYDVIWNGSKYQSGLYFININNGGHVLSSKVSLIK